MSTYTPIASITLATATPTVTFTNIPQTFTDLIVVVSATETGSDGMDLRVGNETIDTGGNYSFTALRGNGSAASSYRINNYVAMELGTVNSTQNIQIAHLMNYSNNTTYKTYIVKGSNPTSFAEMRVGAWRNTLPINTIRLQNGSFVNHGAGSTFNLYGIADAGVTNVAKATGGDSVYTDGTYWYHTFLSSGTFTPTQSLTADYLVVAGGGGGGFGQGQGGGGGAGGVRCTVGATGGGGSLESTLSLTAQAYTVTIGAGGTGGSSGNSSPAASGSNSVFSTITSLGGGGGGNWTSTGGSGGSGGGTSAGLTQGTAGGAGTANQGYAGGANGTVGQAGGGGGAGAVGGNGSSSSSGASGSGGNGIQTSISGTATYYGGGGAGAGYLGTAGSAGLGGGGSSDIDGQNLATAGTANTGGGGGGKAQGAGKNGGSGIVIVRYAV